MLFVNKKIKIYTKKHKVPMRSLFKMETFLNIKFNGNAKTITKNRSIEVIKNTWEKEKPFTKVKNIVSSV